MRRAIPLLFFTFATLALDGRAHTPSGLAVVSSVLPTDENLRLHQQTQELMVFPVHGAPLVLPLWHFSVGSTARDGKAFYGVDGLPGQGLPGIREVDLLTLHISVLPGTEAVPSQSHFDVSPRRDFIVVASTDGTYPDCGLYVISQPEGRTRRIRQRDTCGFSLSVSPDERTVLWEKRSGVESVDLSTGEVRPIGNYRRAAWSPDGRWVAACCSAVPASRRGNLVLLDSTFRFVRTLRGNYDGHPIWSPDSRYLLVPSGHCGWPFFGLSALDVETGETTGFNSSHCRAFGGTGYWWVSNDVYRSLAGEKPPR